MRILSFDTSSSVLHVSLLADGVAVFAAEVEPSDSERQAVASLLMPTIDRAVRASGWLKNQIDLIVVNVGPGSFTGIRVGIITGRSLADAMHLPLIPVSLLETSFAAAAQAAGLKGEPAAVVLGSTSNQYFFAAYQYKPEDPAAAVVPPECGAEPVLHESLQSVPHLFCDSGALSTLKDKRAKPLPIIKNIAVNQAKLAFDRLSLKRLERRDLDQRQKLSELFPWHNVAPLYLRNPSVTLKKEHASSNPPNERS
jgi:tRNA threonylcarbamoyl adenosine modification protein YeaZ